MTDATEFERERGVLPVAIFVIAAAYAYYLIFAEMAFPRLAESVVEGPRQLSFLRTLLGAGGLVGGLLAGRRFRLIRYPRSLSNAFRACAVVAVIALMAQAWELLLLTAVIGGLALGWLLVVMVAGLRACVGTSQLGLCVGAGIGLAHGIFSLPWLVAADPTYQIVVATVLVGFGSVVTPWMLPQEPSVAWSSDYRSDGIAVWMAVFLALTWLDSAAFAIVPRPEGAAAWVTAGVAFVAAPVASVLLDRLWLGRFALVAFGLLVVACVSLSQVGLRWLQPAVFNAAGGSLAVAGLIFLAARGGRAWQAAQLFAVSLWVGSAFGNGMARELNTVPWTLLVGAGAVVIGALAWRQRKVR